MSAPRRWGTFSAALVVMFMVGALGIPAGQAAPVKTVSAPDHYIPRMGVLFNHPMSSDRGQILNHVRRMIRSMPPGGKIRIATYSISRRSVVDALIAAKRRGVSVQVLANFHMAEEGGPNWAILRRGLGTSLAGNLDTNSFARMCNRSCRGTAGNLHTKFFLFDNVSGVPAVVVTGSSNLTGMALRGQWNHARTVSDQVTYNQLHAIYREMIADRPVADPWRTLYAPSVQVQYAFPAPGMNVDNDPVMGVLNQVQCTGVAPGAGVNGRTSIRIGMYAWHSSRGTWVARKVRALWEQGCDIKVETSVMSRSVGSILRYTGGRGPIPGKKVGVWAADGTLLKYDHHKFMTINGVIGLDTAAKTIVAGSCNYSDLGRHADEYTGIYDDDADHDAYVADFDRTWNERYAKNLRTFSRSARSSALSNPDANTSPAFGKGKLRFAEPG